MEKLKPLLVYRFWIVFGLVLLLPPIGWMSASGKLAANIAARISTLDGLKGAVPNGQGAPNDDWSQQAEKLVKNRETRNQLALKVLWDSQVRTRNWFPGISKFMAKCPYRGELPDASEKERNEKQQVPDLYRDGYDSEVVRVWKIPFPRQDLTDPNRAKIIDFPLGRMPRIPAATWRGIVPTWPEIWNASEDLWLLEQLMLSVQRANSFATNLADANVKQIEAVELFGGKRLGPTDAPAVAAGASFGEGAMPGGMPGGMPNIPGGMPGAVGGYAPVTTSEFNINEEYEVKSRTGVTAQMTEGMPGGSPGGFPGAVGGTPTAAGTPDEGRYVQDTPTYRTRGFRLKVIVRQQNAMEFVRELLNSKYPIEIVRLQQFALNPAFGVAAGATGGGFGGGFPMPTSGFGGDSPIGSIAPPMIGGELGGANADPLAGLATPGGDTAAAVGGAPQDAFVYQDPHLVSLVILGELYIYNEPKLPEAVPGAPVDPNAAPAATPIDPALGVGNTPEDGSVPASNGEQRGPATTPEAGTPAPVNSTTPMGDADAAVSPAAPKAAVSPADPVPAKQNSDTN